MALAIAVNNCRCVGWCTDQTLQMYAFAIRKYSYCSLSVGSIDRKFYRIFTLQVNNKCT